MEHQIILKKKIIVEQEIIFEHGVMVELACQVKSCFRSLPSCVLLQVMAISAQEVSMRVTGK